MLALNKTAHESLNISSGIIIFFDAFSHRLSIEDSFSYINTNGAKLP